MRSPASIFFFSETLTFLNVPYPNTASWDLELEIKASGVTGWGRGGERMKTDNDLRLLNSDAGNYKTREECLKRAQEIIISDFVR